MDGNRRYAKQSDLELGEGHRKGYDKFVDILQWCQDLGVHELTVYAFSIENFKRSPDEVDFLMTLLAEKLNELLKETENLKKKQICIRIIGNITLLPEEIRQLSSKIMDLTKDHKKLICNIAMPYTSRDELTTAAKSIVHGVKSNQIHLDDINEELVSKCLYTNRGTNPDILIRTSGEVRFSDFLLWQCGYSVEYFVDALWPNFTIWHFLALLFRYQRDCVNIPNFQNREVENNVRIERFLNNLNERRAKEIILRVRN
ncbi:hypothetical protein Trydic_g3259 [Trypoxylus dichotomus]